MVKPWKSISETELEVLKALWLDGPMTVRELLGVLHGQGRSWAYTTAQTLLNRLLEKGYVKTKTTKRGRAHVFEPTVSRDELLVQELGELADRVCEGTAAPLVHCLVQGKRLTTEEIGEFRRLLDDLEAVPPKKQSKRVARKAKKKRRRP